MTNHNVVALPTPVDPDDAYLARQLTALLATADTPTRFAVGTFLAATHTAEVTAELRLETWAGGIRASLTSP